MQGEAEVASALHANKDPGWWTVRLECLSVLDMWNAELCPG